MADDAQRKMLMQEILRNSYSFLFKETGFDIERATADQVATRFRAQGVNGSTLSRAVAFFLSSAKDVGIKVSPNIKPPPTVKNAGSKPKKEAQVPLTSKGNGATDPGDLPPLEGTEILEIPIPINRKVKIVLPTDFKASDWSLFKTILDAYIDAWKAEKQVPIAQKDKRLGSDE
jgi:hypothetical protein